MHVRMSQADRREQSRNALLESAARGTRVEVDLFGEWVGGVLEVDPLFDPKNDRVHGR